MKKTNDFEEKFKQILIELEKETSNIHINQGASKFREFYKLLKSKKQTNTEVAKQTMWECMLFDLTLKPQNIKWRGEKGEIFAPMFKYSGCFKITKKSLEELKKQGLKEEVIQSLDTLINKEFSTKEEVEKALDKFNFSLEQKNLIVKHAKYSNEREYPNIKKFTEEAFSYFKKRADEIKNPIYKCRYCEAIWVLSKDNEKNKYALDAIDLYLECADIYFKNLELKDIWGLDLAHTLQRATELVLTKGLTNKEKIENVKSKVIQLLINLANNKNYRWCLDLTEILLQYELTKEEVDKIIEINKDAETFYKNENNYHIQKAFLLNLIEIYKHIKNDTIIKNINEQIAESYKLEGDYVKENRKPGNLIAAHFYEQSALKYKNLGKKEISDELINKVKECYKLGEQEFIKIKTSMDIPMNEIDEYVNELLKLTPKEVLKQISIDDSLLPNIHKATLKADEDKTFIGITLMPFSTIRDSKKIYDSIKNDEPLDHNIRRNILLQIQVTKVILTRIFEKLKKKSFLTQKILMEFFSESTFFDKENLEFIEVGIERYFKKDYISSLHILVPQLEGVIRKMLENVIQVTKITPKRMQDMTFNEILKKEETWKNFGDNFVIYLYLVLVSQQSLNLRNDIAHGFIKKDICTKETVNLIIHMFIILTSFKLINIEI